MIVLITFGIWVCTAMLFVVAEVLCAMMQLEIRPSYMLRLAARNMGWFFGIVGEFLGRIADVTSAFRRLVILIHDLFFQWIPVELVRQALRDLSAATRALVTTPMEFFYGIGRGLMAATLPLIATATFAVGSLVFLVIWETTTMVLDWQLLRPSTLMAIAVVSIRSASYGTGFFITAVITDLWGLIARGVSYITSIPFPTIRKAIDDMLKSTQNITFIPGDLRLGARAVVPTWPDNGYFTFIAQGIFVSGLLWIGYLIFRRLAPLVFDMTDSPATEERVNDGEALPELPVPAVADRPRRRQAGAHA